MWRAALRSYFRRGTGEEERRKAPIQSRHAPPPSPKWGRRMSRDYVGHRFGRDNCSYTGPSSFGKRYRRTRDMRSAEGKTMREWHSIRLPNSRRSQGNFGVGEMGVPRALSYDRSPRRVLNF